jgi:hypothetical protein
VFIIHSYKALVLRQKLKLEQAHASAYILRDLDFIEYTHTLPNTLVRYTKHNDWCFSLDLQDGYYAVGIREHDRDFFTVNYGGRLLRLACLPMGWNASPYVFCMSMRPMIRYLRSPLLAMGNPKTPSRINLRGQKWKGLKLLPFLDDYLFLSKSKEQARIDRNHVENTLNRLGLARNVKKAFWEPVQVLEHLGLEIDTLKGEFRAP